MNVDNAKFYKTFKTLTSKKPQELKAFEKETQIKCKKSIMKKIFFIVSIGLLFVFNVCTAQEYDTWRFINVPDYHNAEGFSRNIPSREQRIEKQTQQFKQMKERHGGELIIMPGDCNSGHWYRKKYLKQFKSHPDYTNYNTEQVVLEASRLCYDGVWDMVHKGGYDNFLMAVGDHELGDNPWRKGSEVVNQIAAFRQGFANTFTLDKNGKSRFTKKIGKALARPVETIYEHTSNAVQYKNVLFVTLDMFRFDQPFMPMRTMLIIRWLRMVLMYLKRNMMILSF